MTLDAQTIISGLGLIGFGGLVAAWFTSRLERRASVEGSRQEFKDRRYKCTIILMIARLNFEQHRKKLHEARPDISTQEDLAFELQVEWYNMFLFASDAVLRTFQDFILTPNHETFHKAALAMREDLWKDSARFRLEDIRLT